MSAAVMPSSIYDLNELSYNVLKQQQQQQDVSKLSWENISDGDSSIIGRNQQLPISIMTSFLLDNISQHRRLERTQSEPAKVPAQNVNTSRYKTELCRPYEESGTCKYGDKCQFAHGGHELRCLVRHPKYKTELCRTFHTVGFCPYGPRCHFIHNADEARNNAKLRPRLLSLDTTATPSPPSSLGSSSPPPQAYSYTSSTPPNSPPPPSASPESRLPVFNRISAPNAFLLNMHFGVSEVIV